MQTSFWLSQTQPETWRAYALLLTRTGQSALAVEWWQKIAQSRPLSMEDHRNYAAAALSARELIIASAQIDLLLTQQAGPTPRDLVLAGQLATLRGYSSYAVGYAERILGDVSSDSRERLGANLLILANRPFDLPMYAKASGNLLNIARDETDRASTQALAVLAQQRLPGLTNPVAESLSISLPDISNKAISLNEIADRLARNPNSRPFHQMLALELRARAEPARTDELIARAIQSYGDEDDETLVALGSWLYSHSRFESMLGVLPLERAARRRELLMERIDAMASLGRLAEVKELLLREYPVLAQAFQHMYLAVVNARLGETTAAANEWYRALDAATSPRTLIGLADYAEKEWRSRDCRCGLCAFDHDTTGAQGSLYFAFAADRSEGTNSQSSHHRDRNYQALARGHRYAHSRNLSATAPRRLWSGVQNSRNAGRKLSFRKIRGTAVRERR